MVNSVENTKSKEWLPEKVAVLGAGRSGIAVTRFLTDKDIAVFISESCTSDNLDFILASNGMADVPHEADGHTEAVLGCGLVILSPGIPSDIPILDKAREARIPVWSEIELGYRHSKAPFLAVTGSTGKSTTVELLGSILEAAGKEHAVAGNIGTPIIQEAPVISDKGFVAVEISSFQLENIELFRPRVAAVLNLMKNHLDRYESEDDYYSAKKSIVQNMAGEDTLVLNAQDKHCVTWAQNMNGKVKIVFFGMDIKDTDCVWCFGSHLYGRFDKRVEAIGDISSMKIKGKHNIDNVCAAAAMAEIAGIDNEAITKGISEFAGLPHRLEFVREINGVSYYNDSKATTAESVECAVKAFNSNVHLIAGGKDKGCDFSSIYESLKATVKSVRLIGEAAGRILKEWKDIADIGKVESLKDALDEISAMTDSGDVVILSPGCSSFDMFSNFEERGNEFKRLVNELEEGSG
ncbi:UDP-N-acetylmuramoyl-L-alanine--D-glutamate ligase [Fibrobacterota bacterium]